jgi:hypothetical protein
MRQWQIVIILVMFIAPLMKAQEVITLEFVTEGIETTTHSTDLILDDPSASSAIYSADTALEESTEQNPAEENSSNMGGDFSFSPEMEISATTSSFKIPISYKFKGIKFKGNIPYIFKRTMSYSNYDAESAGVGDISLAASYASKLKDSKAWGANVEIKLPTGDAEALDGDYLVPLGSGSVDFSLGVEYLMPFLSGKLQFGSTIRINGSGTKKTEATDETGGGVISTSYDITNGSLIVLKCLYARVLKPRLSGTLQTSCVIIGDGETDWKRTDEADNASQGNYSNRQGTFLLDLTPGVRYHFKHFYTYLNFSIPLITARDDLNREDDRSLSFRFGMKYNFNNPLK